MNDSRAVLDPSIAPDTAASAPIVYPWVPDQGDGTYCNPILCADYSDPDVERNGDDYYLTASSFNCTPGLPILHSRDLVNWTLVNHAVKNLPHPRYEAVQHGSGIWAPSLRHHADRWWIFFAMPDEGIFRTCAEDPLGEWSPPHLVEGGRGLIDPCPFWDEDGRAWLVHAYAHSRAGIRDRLRVRPMAPDGSKLLGEGRIVFHAPERHPILEGPKFLKRNGWYYLLAPAGGVSTGWQVALRSRHIYGPYEDRVVLAQGTSPVNGPHQGGLVDTPRGDWWFVHFQDAGVYGRIVHLQPVHWREDWPLIGEAPGAHDAGQPVRRCKKPAPGTALAIPATSDDFTSGKLGLQWQWHANHRENWHELAPHRLRLLPQLAPGSDLSRLPNLLLQKFPARSFTVETQLTFSPRQPGEEAGLAVIGGACAALALRSNASGNHLVFRTGTHERTILESVCNPIRLRVTVQDGGKCAFSFCAADQILHVPGVFQSQAGTWIGAKVGLFSLKLSADRPSGCADFHYFRFLPAA
jgi:beta-xylosidase